MKSEIRKNIYLENIIENSPIPIIAVDISGDVKLWNKAAEETFGWKLSEIIGKANPIIPKDHQEEFEVLLANSFRGESIIDFRTKRKRKDGSVIDVSISTSAWKDSNGDIIGIIAQIMDISQKIKTENELLESKKELETFFNSSGDALFIHDLDGNMIKVNNEACRRLGYTEDELLRLKPIDLDSDRFKPLVKQRILEIKEKKSATFETEHVAKNGRIIPTEIKSTLIRFKREKAVLSIARDISGRKKAESDLKESEERFRNAVLLAPNPIMIHDEDDNVIQLSNGWTKFSGYTLDDIPTIGDWTEKAYGSRTGVEKEYIDKLFKIEDTVYNGEWKVKCKNGETRIWEFFTTPLEVSRNGKRILLSVAFDITDKKKSEDDLKQSEVKYREFFEKDLTGDFLSTVDGNIVDCNPAFLNILEYDSIEDINLHSVKSFYKNKNDRDELIELIKENKEVSNHELSLITKNGKEIYVIENVVGVFNSKGILTHLRGYIFDITARKIAEERFFHVHSLLYAIRNVNQLIVTEKNLDVLMQRTCEIILESRGYSATWIGLTNDLKSYDRLFSYGISNDFNGFSEQLKNGILPGCLKSISLNNPIFKSKSIEDYCSGCIMLPFRKGNGVIASLIKHLNNIYGVLYIITENIDLFTEEEESLIKEVSGDLGLAIYIQQETQKREEAEIRLQNVIDIMPDIVAIADENGRYSYMNKSGLNFFGKSYDKVIGMKPEELLVNSKNFENISALRQKAYETKLSQKDEFILSKNTKKLWYEFAFYPHLDDKGNIIEVLGIARDVTESKTYEQRFIKLAEGVASKVGEEFFDVLVENLSKTLNADVVLIGRVDEENSNKINTISVFQFGKRGENFTYDLIGTPCENVVNKKLCSYEKDVANIFPNDQILSDLKIEGYIGTPLWDSKRKAIGILVCLFKSPIENVKIKESIIHVFGLRAAAEIERLEHLSEILKQRNELEESEQRYRTLADNGQALIWTAGLDKKCNYFNQIWLDFTGRTLEQELGDGWAEGVHPDDLKRCIDTYVTAFDQRKPFSMVYRLRRYDGEYRWIQDDGTPRFDKDGNFIGYIGHCLDVTEHKNVEDALKESESKFRSYVENAFDGIYVMKETHYEYVNNRFCELTGYTEKEITSPDFDYKFLLTDKSKRIVEERYEARKQGKSIPQTYETEIKRKNGTIIDVEISTVAIGTKNDLKILGFMHDITEQIQAVNKIKESEKRYRSITQTATDAIVTVDSNDKIIGWNTAAERIFGYSEQEALNQSLSIIIPPKYWQKHLEGMQRILSGGERKVIGKTIELEGKHKNGSTFPLELSLAEWESSGKKFFTGIIRDITERKSAEENIKKLSRGVEQSPASIVITDYDGSIEYVNKKFTEVTGYSYSEAIDKNPRILKSGKNDPKIYKELWATIKAGKEWRGEFCNKKKNGEFYWEMALISPLTDNERKVTHFIAVKEDITEQKKLVEELTEAKKKAEAADKIKSEFLAQMSHEIRSPLNAVLNFTNLIKEETSEIKSEELDVSFASIDSASKRIIRTVDSILNMSDLQLGTYIVSKRMIDLNELIGHLVLEYKSLAEIKKLDLRFFSGLNNANIETDDYAVSQIFANLIDNAIKYTDEGFIEIRLLQRDNKFIVEIEDSGIGISEEYFPELFSPFSQEEHGYSRKFDGAGLGLSLVKKYCEIIGAVIKVKSKKNVGTTFIVIL